MIDIIHRHFDGVFEPALLEEMIEHADYHELKEGELLLRSGQYIKSMPLLIKGRISIYRADNEGHELLLYQLQPGQTCSVSLNCAIHDTKSSINAVSDADSELLLLPIHKMEDWMINFRTWRQFVLDSHQQRFEELIKSIDSIAFQKMDERLVNYLKQQEKNTNSHILQITHSEIANDLNTSRVVISRLLKQLENKDAVSLARNELTILNL